MTKDEALRLALEALEDIGDEWGFTSQRTVPKRKEAITAIKEALAQTEQELTTKAGELRAMKTELWKQREQDGECKRCTDGCPACDARKLPEQDWIERERAVGYREGHRAALAQRTWVGLTEDEQTRLFTDWDEDEGWGPFIEAIEAKLKEKNT
jgi:hypothetical protein